MALFLKITLAFTIGVFFGVFAAIGAATVIDHLMDQRDRRHTAVKKAKALDLDGMHRAFDHNLRNINSGFEEE